MRFESQMTVTLSCDHRVIDGALGAQLITAVLERIPGGALPAPNTILRTGSGMGRVAAEFCDVLVAGAGPAGLAAALTAGRSGARVAI